MTDPGCDVIRDTLVIPSYVQPAFSSSAAVAVCGLGLVWLLLPETRPDPTQSRTPS